MAESLYVEAKRHSCSLPLFSLYSLYFSSKKLTARVRHGRGRKHSDVRVSVPRPMLTARVWLFFFWWLIS